MFVKDHAVRSLRTPARAVPIQQSQHLFGPCWCSKVDSQKADVIFALQALYCERGGEAPPSQTKEEQQPLC